MKKYKLIKEYPFSPKLGHIITFEEDIIDKTTNFLLVDNYPEFWQEFIEPAKAEKDYEILCYSKIFNRFSHSLTKRDETWDIHSVKRLSDGEVFTIGDKVKYNHYNEFFIINYFTFFDKDKSKIVAGDSIANNSGDADWCVLNNLTKYKEPLFKTEDGVDIFVKDKYWCLNTILKDWIFEETAARDNINYFYKDKSFSKKTGIYYFSTKGAAEEWIIMNKPCLSYNDIISNITCSDNSKKLLKNIIKSKLNL